MLTVREIMTADVVTVPPDMPLPELARLLDEREITGVPVVERDGRMLGVASATDLVRSMRRGTHSLTVSDIMTRGTVSVRPTTTIAALARFIVRSRLHRALVMEEGRLLGIVTAHDVLEAVASLLEDQNADGTPIMA